MPSSDPKQIETLERVLASSSLNKKRQAIFIWHIKLIFFPVMKRLADIFAASIMLLVLIPFIISIRLFQGRNSQIFKFERRIGRWGDSYNEFILSPKHPKLAKIVKSLGISRFASAINLLRGDISLIGPRALSETESKTIPFEMLRRLDVKPGLICLWWIRKQSNVGYDGELAADIEYVQKQNLKTDATILLKALPASVFGESAANFSKQVNILNIPLDNISMNEAIERIINDLKSKVKKQICFINADCANIAWNDHEYMKILHSSDFNLADGIGLKIAGRITEQQIKQNVNGTDLFPRLMQKMSETSLSVYFLGASPDANEGLVANTLAKYFNLKIAGAQHGYYKSNEEDEVIKNINKSSADLLLVAFGAPKQEKWIAKNLPKLNVKVAMGVGGLFDFYSGRIQRSPLWMREIGFEWFYRFMQEPRRMWKRYFIGNALFLYRVIRSNSGLKAPSIQQTQKE